MFADPLGASRSELFPSFVLFRRQAMKRRPFVGTAILLLVTALLLGATATPSAAQATGTIAGQVVATSTQRPLAGAQVSIPGTGIGGLTSDAGRYILAGVPAGEVTIQVQMIGYGQAERTITVAAGQSVAADFDLETNVLALEQLVVTGAGVVTEKKRLGQTVASVNTEAFDEAPVSNVTDVLQGRIPGLVANALGETGAGAPIRLRGSVSLTQRNGPLVYVDGVRIGNEREEFASITTSRLDDLNPEDIERIEVLKGAAAATLYGTEASAGVIQIFTKRGLAGEPQWDFKMTQQLARADASRIPANVVYDAKSEALLSNAPAEDFLRTGHRQLYNLSVRGGSDRASYYLSGWFENEEGTFPSNGLENWGVRTNLTFTPIAGLDTRVSFSKINNVIQAPYPTWGLMGEFVLADPRAADETHPYGELFHTVAGALAYENFETTDRSTISGEIAYQWADDLRSQVVFGYHEASQEGLIFVEPGPDVRNPTGQRDIADRRHSSTTIDASTVWDARISDAVVSTLTLGGQSFWETHQGNVTEVQDFIGPGVTTLGGASTVSDIDETFEEVINAGVFAQEQIGLNDRLFLTAGLRIDGNSTFGEDFGFQPYPKFGASWSVSEEPFWVTDALDLLRLRFAYGTSGLQPGAYDALRTWETQALLANLPAVLPNSVGNEDLKPERSVEIEFGADLGLLENRLGLELTYFRQRTTDAILAREGPASEGFLAPQLLNIGELRSDGFEAAANWLVVDRPGVRWNVHATFATTDQRVTDLGGIPGFKTSSDTRRWNFIREGYQPGAVLAPVLDPADPYELTVPVAEFDSLNQVTPHTLKTADGQDSLVFIGNQLPTVTGSFSTTLDLPEQGLTFSALVRGEGGFVMFDETNLIRAQVGITEETARMIQELSNPATSAERRQQIAKAYAAIHPQVHSTWVQDADYVRLQELAVTWDISDRLSTVISGLRNASVTLAGRNLLLLTRYDGIMDPGSSSTAGNDFGLNVDYFGAPMPRRFELTVRAGF